MNKIDDIMNYYAIDDCIINEIESSPKVTVPLSPSEKENLLHLTIKKVAINSESVSMKPTTQTRRRRFLLLTAAIITILALAAISFAATTLHGNFLNFFSPKNQVETNILNSIGTIIDKKVSNNGLTIHVKEALGDKNAVYVTFDIIAPENMSLSLPQYTFVNNTVNINVSSFGGHGLGYYFTELEDLNPNDNIKPMMLSLSSSKSLVGKEMTFIFKDFSCYKSQSSTSNNLEDFTDGNTDDGNDIYNVLIPGTWEVTFPLNYKDNTKTYKLLKKVSYENKSMLLTEIRLSPISISITMSPINLNTNSIHNAPLLIYLKNGDIITSDDYPIGTNTSTFKTISDMQFNRVINLPDIDYIEYCGKSIFL